MGSKRRRHQATVAATGARRRLRRRAPSADPPATSTFPSFGASGPLPRWMVVFGMAGVAAALAAFVADVLAAHHLF